MGVSADPVGRQRQFAEANDLGFPLLSDPGREVIAQFGAKRLGMLPTKRMTFVINAGGTVIARIASEANMHAHADGALASLRQAATGRHNLHGR